MSDAPNAKSSMVDSPVRHSNSRSSALIAWARLLRVANVPTAWTNVLVAFLFAHGSWSPTVELALLMAATSCLFCGGMVLNDVFDCEVDAIERQRRPIPSGAISLSAARSVAVGLLFLGCGFATAAGSIACTDSVVGYAPLIRSMACGLALVLSIWLYDGPLKRTWLAPLAMGACRFFNVLLGSATVRSDFSANGISCGFPPIVIGWGAVIAVLIAGVTLLAKDESRENNQILIGQRVRLGIAAMLVVIGLMGIASLSFFFPNPTLNSGLLKWFPAIVVLISWRIVLHVLNAFIAPSPRSIKMGVISVLRSLIILDAVVSCLAVPNSMFYSLMVLAMLVPVLWLGKRIPIT